MSDIAFKDKVARDPRVVFAAALNRQDLLLVDLKADLKNDGQSTLDVNGMSDDGLELATSINHLVLSTGPFQSYPVKEVGLYKKYAAIFAVAAAGIFAVQPIEEGIAALIPAGVSVYLLDKARRMHKGAFNDACIREIVEGNQRIIDREIIRRDPDVQKLQLCVDGKSYAIAFD